jgi:HAD superfamily hydrolase (TIGR01509 family)
VGGAALRVRTVTVDLWGTLLLDTPASDNRYRSRRLTAFDAILRSDGRAFSMSQLERAYEDSGRYLRRLWKENRDVPVVEHVKAILRSLDGALDETTRADVLDALVQAYARPALIVPPAFDQTARAGLERLRARGVTLALISNTMRTPGTAIRTLLAGAGLLEYFAHTTFSDEVGIRKPAARIFQDTLRHVGGTAETAVHVGDDPSLDVDGARAAGLRVVYVAAHDAAPLRELADRTINCLGELPDAIVSLERESE